MVKNNTNAIFKFKKFQSSDLFTIRFKNGRFNSNLITFLVVHRLYLPDIEKRSHLFASINYPDRRRRCRRRAVTWASRSPGAETGAHSRSERTERDHASRAAPTPDVQRRRTPLSLYRSRGNCIFSSINEILKCL